MFNFMSMLTGILSKFSNRAELKKEFGVDLATSQTMQNAIRLWTDIFLDSAPWLDSNTQSCNIGASVAGELARLCKLEMESSVTGSARGEYLDGEYQKALPQIRQMLETALAVGSMAYKPYVTAGGEIVVDCVPAWRFFPTAFDSRGNITGCIFPERITKGKRFYTRLEWHNMAERYTIKNLCYVSASEDELGNQCSLTDVEEWAELMPEAIMEYSDGSKPEKPLFAIFRVPFANNVDPESPMGVSVYGKAVKLIEEVDKQYSRILWEYEGSELAVHMSDYAAKQTKGGLRMDTRKRRLYRGLNIIGQNGGDLFDVFSPAIRDTSLFNGFNQLLRRIEFACNLAYGTLSDPQNVDKTAEEVRASKQRSFAAVAEIQSALDDALNHLVWIIDYYTSLYNLAPAGEWELATTWGDSVNEDIDKEFLRRKMLVDQGYMKPESLLAWYFHISEEEALAMLPNAAPALGFEV